MLLVLIPFLLLLLLHILSPYLPPQLAIILGKRWIQSFGYYRIIKWTCYVKFLVPIACFLYGYQRNVYLIFVLLDTCVARSS